MCPSHHMWKCCEQKRYFERILSIYKFGKVVSVSRRFPFLWEYWYQSQKIWCPKSRSWSQKFWSCIKVLVSVSNFFLTKPQCRSRKFWSKKSPSLGINGNYGLVTQCWVALYFVVSFQTIKIRKVVFDPFTLV